MTLPMGASNEYIRRSQFQRLPPDYDAVQQISENRAQKYRGNTGRPQPYQATGSHPEMRTESDDYWLGLEGQSSLFQFDVNSAPQRKRYHQKTKRKRRSNSSSSGSSSSSEYSIKDIGRHLSGIISDFKTKPKKVSLHVQNNRMKSVSLLLGIVVIVLVVIAIVLLTKKKPTLSAGQAARDFNLPYIDVL